MNDPTKALAEDVTTFCEERFSDVASISALATGPLSAPVPRRSGLAIERHCLKLLASTDPPLAGAGVVVAPYVLSDEPYWLEWWLAGPDDAPADATRLAADVNPDSVTFRDYTDAGLVRGAAARPGSAASPVRTSTTCAPTSTPSPSPLPSPRTTGSSVSPGVDVLARWFEQHLFALVDERGDLDEGCVVVNRSGRVVACPVRHLGHRRPDPRARLRPPARRGLAGRRLSRDAVRGGPQDRIVRTGTQVGDLDGPAVRSELSEDLGRPRVVEPQVGHRDVGVGAALEVGDDA